MSGHLAGEVVTFTGKLRSFPRMTAEAAVKDAGGRISPAITRNTTLLVVGQEGWPILPDGSVSSKVQKAEALGLPIVSEDRFLERVGLRPEPQREGAFSADEVCRLLKISGAELERWTIFGIVSEVNGRYDYQDLVSARNLMGLLQAGASVEAVARSLAAIVKWMPETARPLSQLKLVAELDAILIDDAGASMTPTGQYVMPLESEGDTAASDLLQAALDAEDRGDSANAIRHYREYIRSGPGDATALYNLGTLILQLGHAREAEGHLRRALAIDSRLHEGWYNLADVLDELGHAEQSITCLKKCLKIAPGYADAHFNVAALYQRLDRLQEAGKHWERYLELDGNGEWADIARLQIRLCRPIR